MHRLQVTSGKFEKKKKTWITKEMINNNSRTVLCAEQPRGRRACLNNVC